MKTNKNMIEEGFDFTPQFDKKGLIPVIAQDAKTGQVLMFAYMNKEALQQTIKTGLAVYYSRARRKLWKKGEQSGHIQKVRQILVDCNQDSLLLKVSVSAGQCHTGRKSCFYRKIADKKGNKLKIIAKKVFDPRKTYKIK